jgi:zinc transport system permease protein
LSLSVVLLSIFSNLRVSLIGLFFGNILLANITDIIILLVVAFIVIFFIKIYFKQLYNSTFDQEFYLIANKNKNYLAYIFAIIIGVVVGASIQILGALLIGGLLVLPANSALLFKQGFKKSLILTVIIAQITILIGILTSFAFNLPTGATIVLINIACYIGLRLILLWNNNLLKTN